MWSRRLLRRVRHYRQYSSYPEKVVLDLGPNAERVIQAEIVDHYAKAIKKALGVSVNKVDLVYSVEKDPAKEMLIVRVSWAPQKQPGSAPDLDWLCVLPPHYKDNPPEERRVVNDTGTHILRLDGWDEPNRRWIYREKRAA
jgi:hypothetical protein